MTPDEQIPQDAPEPDPYEGQGGSYTLDPLTGRRTLVERTQPADAPAPDGANTSTDSE